MSLTAVIGIIPLALLATVCTVGVLGKTFDDTLSQRIGLSLIAMGSILQMVEAFYCAGSPSPLNLIIYGSAIFAVSTFIKIYRRNKGQISEPKH